MPKITIILPVYNVAKYLPRCIDSVLNQTLKDIEIILATDGPDDCDKICADYAKKDKRIKIISHPGSYGLAVNQGIEIAHGKYIGIVETDDWCDLTMFEKLYNAAEKNNADVVKCGFYFSYDSNPKTQTKSMCIKESCFNPCDHMELLSYTPSVWTAIYSKEFLDKNNIRFMEEKLSYIDSPFYEETFVKAKRYFCVCEPLYFYYMDNPNQSIKSSKNVLDGIKAEQFIFNKLSKDKNLFNVFKPAFLEAFASHLSFHLNRIQNKKDKQYFWNTAHEFVKSLNINSGDFDNFYDNGLKYFLTCLNKYKDYNKYKKRKDEYDVTAHNIKIMGIPVIKVKQYKNRYDSYLLFNKILLLKIKYYDKKTVLRLFNFLPVLTIKK